MKLMKNCILNILIVLLLIINSINCQNPIKFNFDFENFELKEKSDSSGLIFIKNNKGIFMNSLPSDYNYFYYGKHSYKNVEYGRYNVGKVFIYQVPVWINTYKHRDYHYLELLLPESLAKNKFYKISFLLGNIKTHQYKPEQYGIKFSPKKIIRDNLMPLSEPTIMFPVTSEFEMELMNGIVFLTDSTKYLYFGMFEEDTVLLNKKNTAFDVKILENDVLKDGKEADKNFCADKVILDNILIQELKQSDLKIEDIYFDFDKSETNSKQSNKIIESIVNIMSQNTDYHLFIYGYTDAKGSYEYNKILSQSRADFIKNELKKRNISINRLISIGNGKFIETKNIEEYEKSRKVSFMFFE